MDIILGAKLASVVVSPRKDPIILVNHIDEPATHSYLADTLIKDSFNLGLSFSWFEKGGEPLDALDESWELLKVLDKPVGGPSAHGPPPEEQIVIVEHCNVLWMIAD